MSPNQVTVNSKLDGGRYSFLEVTQRRRESSLQVERCNSRPLRRSSVLRHSKPQILAFAIMQYEYS
jgi:hypothetical protein